MATIKAMRERLRKLRSKQLIYSIVFEQIKKYDGVFIDLNQLQLEKGLNPGGKVIGTYSRATELESLFGTPKPIAPKEAGKPYNFQWTGGLFDGMQLKIGRKEAIFGSTDPKAKLLVAKYGELFGHTKQSKIIRKEEYMLPSFTQEVRKILQV